MMSKVCIPMGWKEADLVCSKLLARCVCPEGVLLAGDTGRHRSLVACPWLDAAIHPPLYTLFVQSIGRILLLTGCILVKCFETLVVGTGSSAAMLRKRLDASPCSRPHKVLPNCLPELPGSLWRSYTLIFRNAEQCFGLLISDA